MEDLTGKTFGRLTVIEFDHSKPRFYASGGVRGHRYYWKCLCECGNYKVIEHYNLIQGKINSCGCYNKEIARKNHTTHSLSNTRIYNIWSKIKSRCYRPKDNKFYIYGGRGIKVCNEWKNDFKAFYDWAMNNGYKNDLTIDRINVNGNYEPDNCRWVDLFVQANNKRNNRIISFNNKKLTLAEWAKELNLPYSVLECRINKHKWSIEDALTIPKKR